MQCLEEEKMEEVKLFLRQYYVSELNLKLNKDYKNTGDLISINPVISRKIEKIDDNSVVVNIKIEVKNEGNKPFYGVIVIQGYFECKNWESTEDGKDLVMNTTSIVLFPYLRQAMSTATTLLNVPTYVLPVVNVRKLFKDK